MSLGWILSYMRWGAVGAGLLFIAGSDFAQNHSDSCEAQMPRSLVNTLERTFPGFRVPLEYDNAPEDIAYNKSHGGTGCLGVGTADFTGEGKKDYVIGMTAVNGGGGLAVIALPKKGGWQLRSIQSWREHQRASGYVAVVPPGKYDKTKSGAAQSGRDARESLTCSNPGIQIGTIEATGTVYCFVQGKLLHMLVSD